MEKIIKKPGGFLGDNKGKETMETYIVTIPVDINKQGEDSIEHLEHKLVKIYVRAASSIEAAENTSNFLQDLLPKR